jgi:hypothetical protein
VAARTVRREGLRGCGALEGEIGLVDQCGFQLARDLSLKHMAFCSLPNAFDPVHDEMAWLEAGPSLEQRPKSFAHRPETLTGGDVGDNSASPVVRVGEVSIGSTRADAQRATSPPTPELPAPDLPMATCQTIASGDS